MNEKNYAYLLTYKLDEYFDPTVSWSEEYQNYAYDIVKAFNEFDNPEAAIEPLLQCFERQYTTNIHWFAEFQAFLEQFDKEMLKTKCLESLQRKSTEMRKILLQRLGCSKEELEAVNINREEMLKRVFNID